MSRIIHYKENPEGYGIIAVCKNDKTLQVPPAPGNRHWDAYQVWLSEGNTPDPAHTPEEQAEIDARKAQEAVDEAAEKLIQKELRKQAIDQLKAEGKLAADFKDHKEI